MIQEIEALLSRTRAVLFDFDGPICSVFAGMPARAIARDLRMHLVKRGWAVSISDDLANDPLEVLRATATVGDAAVCEIEDALTAAETRAVDSAEPTAGAEASVRACRHSGRVAGVVSNNSGIAVSSYLERRGLIELVDGPVIGRAPARPHLMKPDPYPIRLALDALGVPDDRVLLVGDSTTDVLAARAAGINCIGYANRPGKRSLLAGADVVLDDMQLLAAALSRVPLSADA